MKKALSKGDRVIVRNSSLSDEMFVEGKATVTRPMGKPDVDGLQRAMVHFDEDSESPDYVVERLIDVEKDREEERRNG